MQPTHWVIIGIFLLAGALVAILPGTEAQVQTTSSYFAPIPPEVEGKFLVTRPGTPIYDVLLAMTQPTYKGAGFLGYTSSGKLFAVVHNGEKLIGLDVLTPIIRPTAYVYEYAPESNTFWELDCSLGGTHGRIILVTEQTKHAFTGPATITPGMTLDTLIQQKCTDSAGALDREAEYSFNEDLYYIGEQYFKDALPIGNRIFSDLIAQGKLSTTHLTSESLIVTNAIITDVIKDVPKTLNCPTPKIMAGGQGGIWTITATSNAEHTPANAFCIQADGNPAYLLEVWRYAPFETNQPQVDYFKVGMRLYTRTGGQWSNIWSDAIFTERYSIIGGNPVLASLDPNVIQTVPVNQPVLVQPGNRFVRFVNQERGDVNISYSINPTTGISITKIDASERLSQTTSNTVFRFKFESQSEALIREILDLPTYDIYGDPENKMAVYLQKTSTTRESEKDKMISATVDGVPHFVTNKDITIGKYTLIIQVTGAKETKITEIGIGENDLSPLTGALTSDIHILSLLEPLTPDPCGKCDSLLACFACVNAKVVEEYE
ncbi:MAG: hypothetical protein Q8P05_01555 [Candidatus Diapherotrites archaeon]|nr:hypothetical protein [Candidatus Diapherotrites archaeon]MDZ4256887.1 hypothetical protein [archaeon]